MNGREAVGRLQKRLSGRSGLSGRLKKYKWVGLVLLVGLLLLAWPAGKENQAETAAVAASRSVTGLPSNSSPRKRLRLTPTRAGGRGR